MSLSIEVLSAVDVSTKQANKKIKAFLSINQHEDGDMRSTPKLSSVPEDVLTSLKQLHDAIKSEEGLEAVNSSKKQQVSAGGPTKEVADTKTEETTTKKRSKVAVVIEEVTPAASDDENNREEEQVSKKAKKDKKKSK